MRSIAMVATLSIAAIWSSSANAGGVVYRGPCGYYGYQQPCGYYGPICRPRGGPLGPFCPHPWQQYKYHRRGPPVGPYWPPYWEG
jgi:hypothetical protein